MKRPRAKKRQAAACCTAWEPGDSGAKTNTSCLKAETQENLLIVYAGLRMDKKTSFWMYLVILVGKIGLDTDENEPSKVC